MADLEDSDVAEITGWVMGREEIGVEHIACSATRCTSPMRTASRKSSDCAWGGRLARSVNFGRMLSTSRIELARDL